MLISVFLADDHQVVLEGFKSLLGAEPDLRVVGEANDGLKVLPAVEAARPDVLVLDITMPGLNGLEVLRHVRVRAPSVKTIIVSMHSTEAYVATALRGGARGYVLKQSPARELVDAIRAVAAGERYLGSGISADAVEAYDARSRETAADPLATLTPRERAVLESAARGLTNQEIADQLAIGKRTVETHRANLMRKLRLKSHAELVRLAIARGVIAAD